MADRTVRLGEVGLVGDILRRPPPGVEPGSGQVAGGATPVPRVLRSRAPRGAKPQREPKAPREAKPPREDWVPAEGTDAVSGQGLLARLRALEERPHVVGPHARLGLVWFLVLAVALAAGRLGLVLVLAPCAGLAALQAVRSRRVHPRPSAPVAGVGAALLVVAAAAGPVAVGVVAVVLVGTVAAGVVVGGVTKVEPAITLLAAGVIGLAGASPVLLLRNGLVPVLVLLTFAAVHDASAYLVGTGAGSAWEGPAAGAASIVCVTLGVAAVLVPPFRGATPWILGGIAIVLAPLGPYAASALMGDRRANVPALRRIDSLIVLAPVWCLVAALLLE